MISNSSSRLATCGGLPTFVVDKAASSRLVHNKKSLRSAAGAEQY